MIPNRPKFQEAIHETRKVNVRFYSTADSGVVDRVCAAPDYGPGRPPNDGLNRYWLRDFTADGASPLPGLTSRQVVELHVLGDSFVPSSLGPLPTPWSVARSWSEARKEALPVIPTKAT